MRVNAIMRPEVELDDETVRLVSYNYIAQLLGKRYGSSHHQIYHLHVLEYDPDSELKFTNYRKDIEPEKGEMYLCEYSDTFSNYDILRKGTRHDKILLDAYKFIYYNYLNYNPETGDLDKHE